MANTFTKTGNYYVSKAGNNANAGTSKDLPKLTIASAYSAASTGHTIVIGEGVYFGAVNLGAKRITLEGDGIVVLDLNGGDFSMMEFGDTLANNYNNLIIRNGVITTPFAYNPNQLYNFNDCHILCAFTTNNVSSGITHTVNFTRCVISSVFTFKNNSITVTSSTAYSLNFSRCTLFNTTINATDNVLSFKDSILESGCVINHASATVANFSYNCIRGGVSRNSASVVTSGIINDVAGNYYDLSIAGSGGTGTVSSPFQRGNTLNAVFYLADHLIAYPTYNANSFSSDPLFNHSIAGNFTISLNSPCFKKSSTGLNVGALETAFVQKAGVDIAGTLTNITGTTDLIVSGGTSGTIEQNWVQYSTSSLRTLGIFRYTGALTFDKSITPPVARNQNVPDTTVYTGGDASGGGNPDRLVFELAWYTGVGTPTVLADADNGGYISSGTYAKFRWGLQPSFDSFGVSNGEPNWNPTVTQIYLACTYFKPRFTLTNAYS